MQTLQFGLPYCPTITKQMAKHHPRLLLIRRELSKSGIQSTYLTKNQLHIHPVTIPNFGIRHGFVIQIEATDLPGILWTIEHLKVWSMSFNHTFTFLAVPTAMLFQKLVSHSILNPCEL